jgi:hypothetical protein
MQPDAPPAHVQAIVDAAKNAARDGDALHIALQLICVAKCLANATPAMRVAVAMEMRRVAYELDPDFDASSVFH